MYACMHVAQLLQRHDGFYWLWPAQHCYCSSLSDPLGEHLSTNGKVHPARWTSQW
jgi:hypothetical protein